MKAKDITSESLRQSLLIPGPEASVGPNISTKESSNRLEAQNANSSSSNTDADIAAGLEEEQLFVHARRFQGRSSASGLLSDALKLTMTSDVGDTVTYSDIMTRHFAVGHAYYLVRLLSTRTHNFSRRTFL